MCLLLKCHVGTCLAFKISGEFQYDTNRAFS
jgi:hypothetical protein